MVLCSGVATVELKASQLSSARGLAPWVSLRITTPDGETLDRSARGGDVASVTLRDGTIYELRPTVEDESVGKVTVTIFRVPVSGGSNTMLGEVSVVAGGEPVESNTKPRFRIAVTKRSPTT